MATLEDEIKDLKDKNNELVQKVQFWKVAAANKENEKLELMKEINELRLKLSRLRSGGAAQTRKLEAAIQAASEEALTHLVKASGAVARTMELTKTYTEDKEELNNESPRWSAISGTPNSDRVHRVPPLLIGGQSIQPVVSLSRTLLNTSTGSHSRSLNVSRSPNQNRSVTERAVPMHMLQDVYIPLTRIDASELPANNMEAETESNELNNSTEELGLDDSGERSVEDSQNMSEGEDFESSRRLEAVTEDLEPEDIDETPTRIRTDNPLEGPSWLLDRPTSRRSRPHSLKSRSTLEPDSTTQLDDPAATPPATLQLIHEDECRATPLFSPTVRRRKRTSSPPHYSPRPAARRNSNSGRVLKVLVAKMRLDSDSEDDVTPPKRPALAATPPKRPAFAALASPTLPLSRELSPTKRLMRFDAPSPNGATDARVIVLEQRQNSQSGSSGEPMKIAAGRRDSRVSSHDSRKYRPRDCGDGPGQTREREHTHGDSSMEETRGRLGETSRVDGLDSPNRGRVGETSPNVGDDDDDELEVLNRDDDRISVTRRRGNVGSREGRIIDDSDLGSRMGSDQMSRVGSEEMSRVGSVGADRDSDSSTELVRGGRTRRPRRQVVYKEKSLKWKMRR